MFNRALVVVLLSAAGCATASYAGSPVKALNPMVETYMNSPLQGARLRCDFAALVEQGGKAANVGAAASDLLRCMPAPLVMALKATKMTGDSTKATSDEQMNAIASQLCGRSSPLHAYYQAVLPQYMNIAISDGWPKSDYLDEMNKDYDLFCSQYYEGLLSDIATRYGLKSVVTGTSDLGRQLDPQGQRTYQEMSQVVLTCSVHLIQGEDSPLCKP